jgi:hypothetical protein
MRDNCASGNYASDDYASIEYRHGHYYRHDHYASIGYRHDCRMSCVGLARIVYAHRI